MLTRSKIQSIRELHTRKARDAAGVFLAETPKTVGEFLAADNVDAVELFAVPEWLEDGHADLSQKDELLITPCSSRDLERISTLSTPNRVLGVFRKPVFDRAPAGQAFAQHTLLLDTLQDPGNLGTIIRCADWFGIRTVVASPGTVDAFNPKVVQSTMGSLARVQVIVRDLTTVLAEHPDVPVYAAALDGSPLREVEVPQRSFILIGNEAHGLSGDLLDAASHRITITGSGQAESLNAAIATAIILHHFTT